MKNEMKITTNDFELCSYKCIKSKSHNTFLICFYKSMATQHGVWRTEYKKKLLKMLCGISQLAQIQQKKSKTEK